MFIDQDIRVLGKVPQNLLENFSRELNLIEDWAHSDFDRAGGITLPKTVYYSYGRRPEPFQVESEQVLKIRSAFRPLSDWVETVFPNHVLFKCDISCALPHSIIPYHYDHCWFNEHASRIHIPIITNDQCFFLSEDRLNHLPAGSYYEVNNRILHSFWNKSSSNRIHAILDIFDKDIYNKAVTDGIDFNLPSLIQTSDPYMASYNYFISTH